VLLTAPQERFVNNLSLLHFGARKHLQAAVFCWLCCVSVVVLSGCGESPTGPADTRDMSVRGMTLVDWSRDGYSNNPAEVDAIHATGSNALAVLITLYQADASASVVRADNQKTPSQQAFADAVLEATKFAPPMRTLLKVHVDLDDGEWRGTIDPSDPAAWFRSYGAALASWAGLAEQLGVDDLVVGTELAGTLQYESQWRDLIASTRQQFSGGIYYAASWDESFSVPFWDAVDAVGINFYAPVSQRDQESRFDILAGWQLWIDRIRLLHKQTGQDILFTEIGYRSVDGAGQHPYQFDNTAAVDFAEQADLYWAALTALGDKPWVQGVYWWNWLAQNGSPADETDYTPKNKPAQKELSDAWGQ